MLSVVAAAMGLFSIAGLVLSVLVSFGEKGNPPVHIGGVGLFGMIGNVVGAFAAMNSLNERDIYRWVSYAALAINITGMLLWTMMIVWGI